MIPLTVFMLIMLLCLAPLKIAVMLRLDLSQKRLFAEVRLFFVRVLMEEFLFEGRNLVCSGTVNTQIDVFQMDGKQGVNLAKALVFDSVNVRFAVDFCKYSPFAMVCLESVCYATTAVACAFSHCKVRTSTCFSQANCVFANVVVSVSLAEIILALIKDSVRKRKNAA